MPAVGILSQKKFFPKNGDILDDLEGEISWTCERAHSFTDRTGATLRYALLIGRHHSLGETPIPKLLTDNRREVSNLLVDINVVHREKDGKMVKYVRNVGGNYEET